MTPLQVRVAVRGERGRTLHRLIAKADRRAQRRFRVWLESGEAGSEWSVRAELSDRYLEAENLVNQLQAARYGK